MTDYIELAELADRIFAIAEDDLERFAGVIADIDPSIRDELLHSDFLNALQVFYVAFGEVPTELAEERLLLEPATAVANGILLEDRDLLELYFAEIDGVPSVLVTDGEAVRASFTGRGAYGRAVSYSEEYEP
ncbi:MAG: hypothetical protein GKC04_06170 [Methanomicrobiales archaeon]|nr:hypothetical protein [Methanomicrobiales archaeon]